MRKKTTQLPKLISPQDRSETKVIGSIVAAMDGLGIYNELDGLAISLLGRLVCRLNKLPSLCLPPDREIDYELKLMTQINRQLSTLGLTKTKQLELTSAIRGRGRPSKNSNSEMTSIDAADWEDILDG